MSGSDRNPLARFLRGAGMLVGGLAEASRRFGEWYEQNEPRIRRFSEVALQVLDGMPNWMSRCVVTFARGGWSEAPLGRMDLSEFMGGAPDPLRAAAHKRALPQRQVP